MPSISVSGGNTTAAATTGPASGPTPDLIDSCNVHDAGLPENALEMQHRIEPFALFGLLFEAPGKRVVQFPGAGTRIPL